MNWIVQHKLIFITVIIVLALLSWYGLSQSAPPAPILTTDTTTGSPTSDSADQQLVATLLALHTVTLTGAIFTDPAFTKLQDFSTTIVPEPVGRDNPFAPLISTTTKDNPHAAQLFTPKR